MTTITTPRRRSMASRRAAAAGIGSTASFFSAGALNAWIWPMRTATPRSSGPAPPLTGAVRGLEFQLGHEKQIDDADGIIWLGDDERTPAGDRHDELARHYRERSPVGEVDDERPKRLRLVSRSELLDSHDSV